VPGEDGKVFYLHLRVCSPEVEGVNRKKEVRDFSLKEEDGCVHLYTCFFHSNNNSTSICFLLLLLSVAI